MERHPITLTSKTLLNAIWDIDQKIAALETERDQAIQTGDYWKREYESLYRKHTESRLTLDTEVSERLVHIPSSEEVEAGLAF